MMLSRVASTQHCCLQAEAHRVQTLADKAQALPPEPSAGGANTVSVLIRLPNGQRRTRRSIHDPACCLPIKHGITVCRSPTSDIGMLGYLMEMQLLALIRSFRSRVSQVPEDGQAAVAVRFRGHQRAGGGAAARQLPAGHQHAAQGVPLLL